MRPRVSPIYLINSQALSVSIFPYMLKLLQTSAVAGWVISSQLSIFSPLPSCAHTSQALSVGIFPYVLKLLQTSAVELRQILVFIWTKILALDKSCQVDLVRDGGHMYFIKCLETHEPYSSDPRERATVAFQRAMAAFVLALICDGHPKGHQACLQTMLPRRFCNVFCLQRSKSLLPFPFPRHDSSLSASYASPSPPVPTPLSCSPGGSHPLVLDAHPSRPSCGATAAAVAVPVRGQAVGGSARGTGSGVGSTSRPSDPFSVAVRATARAAPGDGERAEGGRGGGEGEVGLTGDGGDDREEGERLGTDGRLYPRPGPAVNAPLPVLQSTAGSAVVGRMLAQSFDAAGSGVGSGGTAAGSGNTAASGGSASYLRVYEEEGERDGGGGAAAGGTGGGKGQGGAGSKGTGAAATGAGGTVAATGGGGGGDGGVTITIPPLVNGIVPIAEGACESEASSGEDRSRGNEGQQQSDVTDSATYLQSMIAVYTLARDPAPSVSKISRQTLAQIGSSVAAAATSLNAAAAAAAAAAAGAGGGVGGAEAVGGGMGGAGMGYDAFMMPMMVPGMGGVGGGMAAGGLAPSASFSNLTRSSSRDAGTVIITGAGAGAGGAGGVLGGAIGGAIGTPNLSLAAAAAVGAAGPVGLPGLGGVGAGMGHHGLMSPAMSPRVPSPLAAGLAPAITRSTSWVAPVNAPHPMGSWRQLAAPQLAMSPSAAAASGFLQARDPFGLVARDSLGLPPMLAAGSGMQARDSGMRRVMTAVDFSSSQQQQQQQQQQQRQIGGMGNGEILGGVHVLSSITGGGGYPPLRPNAAATSSDSTAPSNPPAHTTPARAIPAPLSAPLSASLSASLLDPFLSLDAAAAAQAKPVPKSGLYAWSCGHLSRPLLEAVCDAEAETRRAAREKKAVEGVAECRRATVSKVSDQIASFDTESDMMTEAVLLHPFLPLVCIADENEVVRIWNYEEGLTVSTFDNQTGGGGGVDGHKGVSQLCLLNELDDTLLLVASRDGSVRVWRDFARRGKQRIATAWQAPSYVAAGCDDGSVRLFDIRSQPRAQLVCGTHHHSHRVAGIAFHPASTAAPQIISASSSGEIVFLDARNPGQPIRRVEAHKGHLTALSVHRHLPVMATGSSKQLIRVFNMSGDLLSVVRYHNSFLGQRIGPVSALHFHPYKRLLAAGATDSIVSIYAGETHRS
ncbi:unnamed protein product [Closterium sp. Yama58-4]|nr:unnamed protein product [Closterium sp. Yama58-4]